MRKFWQVINFPLLFIGLQLIIAVVWSVVALFMGVAEENIDVIAISIVSSLVTFVIVWVICHNEWRDAGVWVVRGLPIAGLILCFIIGPFLSIFTSGAMSFMTTPDILAEYNDSMSGLVGNNFVLEVLALVILAPILEEVIFRGVVLQRLIKFGMDVKIAVFLQAVIFGIIHFNFLQSIYTVFMGIVLGVLYLHFRSLWAPIIMHITYNSVSVVAANVMALLGIVVDETEVASDFETIIMTVAALGISALIMYFILKIKRPEGSELGSYDISN